VVAKRSDGDLRRYAVVGAEHRLLEIAEEAGRIFQAFPELRARGRGLDAVRGASASAGAAPAAAEPRGRRRRRRKMSAEARKRISDAQKARWAKQKSGGGTKKR
jgi:hypothetical protein